MYKVLESKGKEDETYRKAKAHVQHQCRANGIDAALAFEHDNVGTQLDALLILDRKGGGQQIAAQAGYPIITIPIGLDDVGVPLALSLQQSAWQEGTLIKWASAVEDLLQYELGWRPTPRYVNHTSKNVPINSVPN